MRNILLFAFVCLIAFTGCKQPYPVKTIENLKAGIKGETTASAKYAAFAQKAREEGYNAIAKLFDATSKSESIHANNHQKVLDELGQKMDDFTPTFEIHSTVENLMSAIEGETYEITTMYPQFLIDVKKDKVEKAEKSFVWASETEKKHQQFYTNALEILNSNAENTLSMDYMICPVCGNTFEKKGIDDKCTFCQTGKEKFISI